MSEHNFTISMLVNKEPQEVYDAINNVRGWWSEIVEGITDEINGEFVYRHKNIHYSRQKLVELVPAKKIVWLVTDSSLNFVEHKSEWTATRIIFEISRQGRQTQVLFTHQGLVPEVECFDACSGGWNYYLKQSLLPLINSGRGNPDRKEDNAKAKVNS
jgi:Activator of Hsp90 ATPase homolog 1-like protein